MVRIKGFFACAYVNKTWQFVLSLLNWKLEHVLANQGPNIANNWIWGTKHVFTIDFLFYWSLELHGFCPAIALMSQKVCAE